MDNFLDKLRKKSLDLKKKAMIKEIKDKGNVYSGNTGKKFISANETVEINSKTQELIKSVKSDVEAINKNAGGYCEKLLAYIEAEGTKVFRIKNASKLLGKINEHTGFITGLDGAKAIYIKTIVGESFGLKSEPIFIIDSEIKTDYYMLLREFYLWYSYKKGLDGFDFKTQELFKRYMNSNKNLDVKNMNYDSMCALQEAIHRDSEANQFVMEFIKQKEGGENVLKKMQDGGADI
jgi:hypothetical protein